MKLFIEHFCQPKFLLVWNQLESTKEMERDQMVSFAFSYLTRSVAVAACAKDKKVANYGDLAANRKQRVP